MTRHAVTRQMRTLAGGFLLVCSLAAPGVGRGASTVPGDLDGSCGAPEQAFTLVVQQNERAYGFKTYDMLKIALYHTLGDLPTPEFTHKFC